MSKQTCGGLTVTVTGDGSRYAYLQAFAPCANWQDRLSELGYVQRRGSRYRGYDKRSKPQADKNRKNIRVKVCQSKTESSTFLLRVTGCPGNPFG